MPYPEPGLYYHRKTNSYYTLLFIAHSSDNHAPADEPRAVYVSLSTGVIRDRRLREFTEPVIINGRSYPRFDRVGHYPARMK